jgi:GNAT superfamily N-acetyltransferase
LTRDAATHLAANMTGAMGGLVASPRAGSLERALQFMRSVLVGAADEVRPVPAGLLVRTPSLPAVWAANQLRVTEKVGYDELIGLADEERSAVGYVDLAVEDQQAGPALERAFRAAGWKVERDLVMILSASPERPADPEVVVAETGQDELMELMARWYGEDADRVELLEYNRREVRVYGDRLLGVRGGDGRLAAMSKLRSDGRVAQVEDVYTTPEARGRGYARALVHRAIELARDGGAELTFIVADDNDWPKLLYRQIGFRPLGRVWHFHRG